MRASSLILIVGAVTVSISVWSFWQLGQSLRDLPPVLTTVSGEIDFVDVSTARVSKSQVRFRLAQSSHYYSYPLFYPKYHHLAEHLAVGKHVEWTHRPGEPSDVWSVKLNGDKILSPVEAKSAHRREGYWALGAAVFSLVAGVYLLRASKELRGKGI